MKNLFIPFIVSMIFINNIKAQGDPGLLSAGFLNNMLAVGQTTTLVIEVSNNDFGASLDIPAGGYRLTISLPATLVYRAEPLTVAAFTQVSGPAFNNFTYDGTNVFTADLAAIQAPGDKAIFNLVVKGLTQTSIPVATDVYVTGLQASVISSNNSGDDALEPTARVITVLPITLNSFAGSIKDCSTLLKWKTSQEENFNRFDVQFSEDGGIFNTIGSVAGANALAGSSYQFSYSQSVVKGFYRLKLLDKNGRENYSDMIKITNNCLDAKATIYPNPVTTGQNLSIVITNFSKNIKGTLMDAQGKQLQILQLKNGTNVIQTKNYSNGSYMLNIFDDNGNKKSFKIYISH